MEEINEKRVLDANRLVYDAIADIYEEVDGRRGDSTMAWMDGVLRNLSERTSGGRLLDFGCGTGLVLGKSRSFFREIYGLDVSLRVMKQVACKTEGLVLGDGKPLPFKDDTFDVASFFSVLHHLYDVQPYFKEAYRVIKPGGILYTDHDLDNKFFRRFKYPISVYRKLFDRSRKITGRKAVSGEAVRLSEFRSEGLHTGDVSKALKDAGFRDIKVEFHWLGLNPLANKLSGGMRGTTFRQGFAPLMSVTAVK